MTQAELRRRITALREDKRNFPSVCGLLATGALIALGFWLLKTQPLWLVALPVFLLNGFMQYRFINAAHEAVHKNLLQPVWLNELVGQLCGSLAGVSMRNYRAGHLDHHKLDQSIADDADGYIYRPLIQAKPGWPRLRLLVAGLFADIWMKLKRKFLGHERESARAPAPGGSTFSGLFTQMLPLAIVQGAVWALFWWQVNWWSYFVFWFAPIFFVALFLDRARTFTEHTYSYFFPGPANPNLAESPQATIDVQTSFLDRFFLAPFGFAWHQAHHAQLNVPFYHLRELSALLEEHQPGYVRRIKASYFTLLRRVLWAGKPQPG